MKYIIIFLILPVILFVLLLDFLSKHQIYYETVGIFREWVKPELYDDTYGASWPVEGGSPFKVVAEIEFEGKKYRASSTVRCYQYRHYSTLSNQEFLWTEHLSSMAMPLKGEALLSFFIPDYCDRINGPLNETLEFDKFTFKYVDDQKYPTFIAEYPKYAMVFGNMAISSDLNTLNPRTFKISAFPIKNANISYTSNRDASKFKFLFGGTPPARGKSGVKQAISFSGLSGFLYFRSQWRNNPDLVEFLKDKTEPILIPKKLLEDLPHTLEGLLGAEEQVTHFLSKKNLHPVQLNHNETVKIWLRLAASREWAIDFDSIGVKRAFRRGCDDDFQNCSKIPVGRKAAEFDQVRVGGRLFDISSQPAIYLPEEQIIIQLSSPYTFSTYLM